MKKLIAICLLLCLFALPAQATYYPTPEAKTIAIREFDTIYPGLTQEMKDNIGFPMFRGIWIGGTRADLYFSTKKNI